MICVGNVQDIALMIYSVHFLHMSCNKKFYFSCSVIATLDLQYSYVG